MTEHANSAGDPLFVNLRDDDPALLAAVIEAREKLPQFKAAFSAMQFKPAVYVVKVPLVDRSRDGQPALVATSQVMAEHSKRPIAHLWLGLTSIMDDMFFCFVGEAPKQLGLKKGDSFVIAENVVEDWMIDHQGVAYGGFSLRVLRNRLDATGQRKFDEHTGIHEFKRDIS
jgi:uncharacterized protein YegJ (DUF2314 family)